MAIKSMKFYNTLRQLRGIAPTASIWHLAPKSATDSRAGSTNNGLFSPLYGFISFPDDPHQLSCRYTPLQTVTIPLIIETSSEH